MKNKRFVTYYAAVCIAVIFVSFYPLYMGWRVIGDMIAKGTVMKEDYPKYIIPYTPISIALLTGLLLMPLCVKRLKRFALPCASAASVGVFFAAELLFEKKVVVTASETVTKLEDWQMFMCYIPPEAQYKTVTEYKTQTPVDILMGNYNPAFKLHFYLISVVLILSLLNCLYGFAQMIVTGERKRFAALILQSVSAVCFLGLCILACFTAFWRDGNIQVSPRSAFLMAAFFILLGMTVGIYAGSLLLGKKVLAAVAVPAALASAATFMMYIGEMILLSGHVYRFGSGMIFGGIPGIVLAPVDLIVTALPGALTALLFSFINRKKSIAERS